MTNRDKIRLILAIRNIFAYLRMSCGLAFPIAIYNKWKCKHLDVFAGKYPESTPFECFMHEYKPEYTTNSIQINL